jgi:hypothetical protein
MTETRKVRVWRWRPRPAETLEISLPRYWHRQDLFDSTGEVRDTYVRLLPDGVRTQIVSSQMSLRDQPAWSIETTWSSSWLDPRAVHEFEFVGDMNSGFTKPLAADEFEALEDAVQAMIAAGPQPPAPGFP